MSVTLTASYRETLKSETVEYIDTLVDQNYELTDMLEFIDENSEDDFVTYYEEYVEAGEAIGYEAVDALITESGVDAIENCVERYCGFYNDVAEFAEECADNMGYDLPSWVVVDWEQTWEANLSYEHTACNDGTSYRPVHIFRDY